jgi:hypothetical protein
MADTAATWACPSCGEAVEYIEPISQPRIFTDPAGRTTFVVDGSVLHQCCPGAYRSPTESLFALRRSAGE